MSRLKTNPSGAAVTEVEVERTDDQEKKFTESFAAGIVVVSAGAVNSAALLLRSANERHPRGLANASGQVGRNYMRHNNQAFMAISRRPNPTVFQKTLALSDFYFRSPDWEFPLGFIQMLGKSDGEMLRGEAPDWAVIKPEMALDAMAAHSIDFWLTSEDLPDPENRVTLRSDGSIQLCLRDSNSEGLRRLTAELKKLLHDIGLEDHLMPRSLYLGKRIPIGGTAHQAGTVRMGGDPRASVLDVNCKAHELDNLYVVDAACFVSIAAVNPALTIIANALRVGDHLASRI